MDNSSSDARLDYENGPIVAIAVGGNTLSRGLTLEGLSVSYFVRSVSAYDTLLQMGRWFGFRKGYADLPRIWMTDELADWFRHIATVEAEMRRDIDVYMTEAETPLTFAVRLRTHPAMRVTAAAKMRDAVVAASSYGGRRLQTHCFHTGADWLCGNLAAARTLVAAVKTHRARIDELPERGHYIFRDVPHDLVTAFLASYQFHEKSETDGELITGYINKRVRTAGSLGRWNIAIMGQADRAGEKLLTFAEGVTVGRIDRSRIAGTSPDFADIKTLMSRRDAAVDLAGDTEKLTEKEIKAERKRQFPDHGLLVLYPIDKVSTPAPSKERREPLNAEEHVIGVGLVFPEPRGEDSTVEKYISADLSGVQIEDEDYSFLDSEGA
jgi:hypothetical protein